MAAFEAPIVGNAPLKEGPPLNGDAVVTGEIRAPVNVGDVPSHDAAAVPAAVVAPAPEFVSMPMVHSGIPGAPPFVSMPTMHDGIPGAPPFASMPTMHDGIPGGTPPFASMPGRPTMHDGIPGAPPFASMPGRPTMHDGIPGGAPPFPSMSMMHGGIHAPQPFTSMPMMHNGIPGAPPPYLSMPMMHNGVPAPPPSTMTVAPPGVVMPPLPPEPAEPPSEPEEPAEASEPVDEAEAAQDAFMASKELILTVDQCREAMAEWPNWTLNDECTSLSRRVAVESFATATAFIQAMTEMSEEHEHFADIQMSKGKELTITLSTTVDGVVGLSPMDFLMADNFDQIPFSRPSPPAPPSMFN